MEVEFYRIPLGCFIDEWPNLDFQPKRVFFIDKNLLVKEGDPNLICPPMIEFTVSQTIPRYHYNSYLERPYFVNGRKFMGKEKRVWRYGKCLSLKLDRKIKQQYKKLLRVDKNMRIIKAEYEEPFTWSSINKNGDAEINAYSMCSIFGGIE